MPYREEWVDNFIRNRGYENILSVALAVHEENSGSADSMSPELLEDHKKVLQNILDNWKYSDRDPPFDKCVKDVLHAALEEVHWSKR